MQIAWHREGGGTERQALVPGQPLDLHKNAPGDFLVLDPEDVHPDWWLFLADEPSAESYSLHVVPLRVPGAAAEVSRFSEIPGAHQLAALGDAGLPPLAPGEFPGFSSALDAESAKAVSIDAACTAAGAEADPLVKEAWAEVLAGALTGEPHWLGLGYVGSYGTCSDLVSPSELFASEWAELKAGLETASVSEERLVYLSRFDLPLAEALEAWGNTARSAYSLRARALAGRELRSFTGRLEEGGQEDREALRSLILELLGSSEASELLRQVIPTATALGGENAGENADLLEALGDVLRSPATRLVHAAAVCSAFVLTAGDQGTWAGFIAGIEGAPLSRRARELVADPRPCL
jgi:hypothetical protein